MSSKTTAAANAELDAYWGANLAGGFKLGLLTAITDGAAGTVTESADGAYARQDISFAAAANRQKASNATITYPVSTGANPPVCGYGIYTGAGVLKRVIPITPSLTYTIGYQIIVDSGSLVVTEAAYA